MEKPIANGDEKSLILNARGFQIVISNIVHSSKIQWGVFESPDPTGSVTRGVIKFSILLFQECSYMTLSKNNSKLC